MTTIIKDKGKLNERKKDFNPDRLVSFIYKGLKGLNISQENVDFFVDKVVGKISFKEEVQAKDINRILMQDSLSLVDDIKDDNGSVTPESLNNVQWNKFARYVLLNELYKRASKNRSYDAKDKYGDYLGFLLMMTEKGLYDKILFEKYTQEELKQAGDYIKPERDLLFDYAGVNQLKDRYLVTDKDKSILELPQERFMTMALHLSSVEKEKDRLKHAFDLYDKYSKLQISSATPTFMNSGTPQGALSSCHVITFEDSLTSIFDSISTVAEFSKQGAGLGTYLGKIRSNGSDIRDNVGASSGVIPWIKILDKTLESVNQLGQRAGAGSVYLDIWHADLEMFLDLQSPVGDQNMRAYNVFPGLTVPDEFMRQVEKRGDWYLFDPHQIKKVMGFSLEDYYDKKKLKNKEIPNKEDHAWTYRYYQCVDNGELTKKRIPAIDIMKKILKQQLEKGKMFMFYRDTVNRDNPNSHAGIIYSSNLCTEIAMNMTATEMTTQTISTEAGDIVVEYNAGDMVTCNLSALVLNNINVDDDKELEDVIKTQVRALDNVISLQRLTVPDAIITNNKYRAIGSGTQGIAALLASKHIMWDSEKAINYIDKLEEKIMLYTIKASSELGKEKGSYPVFEGSQWNTGEWIDRRLDKTTLDEWEEVKKLAKGHMRNAYVRSPMPTGGTSILMGSTPGVDPIFDIIYQDGKANALLPIVVPNLTPRTWFYYKPTMKMEYEGEKQLAHMWSILQNEKRQQWVDQSTSFNLYIPTGLQVKHLLRMHMEVWERGIKTTYYVRSWDSKQEEACLACSA